MLMNESTFDFITIFKKQFAHGTNLTKQHLTTMVCNVCISPKYTKSFIENEDILRLLITQVES